MTVSVEDVRLLKQPEQDVGGLSIGSTLSSCMAGYLLQSIKGLFMGGM